VAAPAAIVGNGNALASSTTRTATFTASASIGDVICVSWFAENEQPITGISDTQGNTYTLTPGTLDITSGNGIRTGFAYSILTTAVTTSDTVTVTWSDGSFDYRGCSLIKLSGGGTYTYDGSNQAQDNTFPQSNNVASGDVTPTTSSSVCVGANFAAASCTFTASSSPSAWTELYDSVYDITAHQIEWIAVTSTAAIETNPTASTSVYWNSHFLVFQYSEGGGGGGGLDYGNVVYDTESESHTGTTGASGDFSWTHTPTGTAAGILVFVINRNGSASNEPEDGAVTYGGVAVPVVTGGSARDTTTSTEGGWTKAYFLGDAAAIAARASDTVAVAVGSATFNNCWAVAFTVTNSNGGDTDYAGVLAEQNNQALTEESINDGSPGGTSTRFAGIGSGLSTVPSAGANSTAGPDIDYGAYCSGTYRETTAGSGSRPVGADTGGTSDDVFAVYLAVIPVGVAFPFQPIHHLRKIGHLLRR